MAVREPAPKDLLTRFSHPLWERLRLEDLKPEWIVKGQHRGYDWMAIELTHRATGFVMGSNRLPDTTAVFVLRLLRKSKGRYLPADRIPPGRQVCVDDECVYAAALGQQPRVRDWHRWLDAAADAADEALQTRAAVPHWPAQPTPLATPRRTSPAAAPPTGIGCCSGRWWCMH
jgi:hypothetical protein